MGIPFIWDALIFMGISVIGGLKQMGTDRKKRIQKVQERALESLGYVIDYHEMSDFEEVAGRMGRCHHFPDL